MVIAYDLYSKQSNRRIDQYKVFYIFDKIAFISYLGSAKQKYPWDKLKVIHFLSLYCQIWFDLIESIFILMWFLEYSWTFIIPVYQGKSASKKTSLLSAGTQRMAGGK